MTSLAERSMTFYGKETMFVAKSLYIRIKIVLSRLVQLQTPT